jgi:4-phytase / acid phosphatase
VDVTVIDNQPNDADSGAAPPKGGTPNRVFKQALTQTKAIAINPTTPNTEPKPSAHRRKAVAGSSFKIVLAGLMLAVAMEGPVLAQTTNAADDGTILKQIIFFGRHSIRTATSDTNSLDQCSANPFPDFVGVTVGYLTPNGQQAAGLLGSYFHEYLLHEGLLTGDASSDLARSYFRANIIERSYMTAAKIGAGLIPGANIPVHTYYPTPTTTPTNADPVFDPLLAGVATVDPVRALAEAQGVFGSGTNLSSAYSGELSLISNLLYPPGTHPLHPGISPTNNAPPGSFDPTTVPITLGITAPLPPPLPPYDTGNVISMGGLDSLVTAADPFVMQYADGFPSNDVGWGRLTVDELSQQTRINTLQIEIAMRQPYLARVQSSSAASHILRTMIQTITGTNLAGAFGDTNSQIHVIVSSDYYVAGLAGLLDAHWLLSGYQRDFCPPGGTLVFELRQVRATGQYLVRVFYTAQTFDQLRNLTPLTLAEPPATMQLLIPGCSSPATNLDVSFISFSNLLSHAIGLEYVQPFDRETPPGVLDPYNPTNITASVSGNTLTIAWPADHLGWILQARTNGLSTGQWFDLPGSSDVNSVAHPIALANAAVFYRLRQP